MRLLSAFLSVVASVSLPCMARADCAADFAAMMQAYHDAGPRKVQTELSFTSNRLAEGNTRTSIARIVLPDGLDLHTEDSSSHIQNDAILVGGKGFAKVDGGWQALSDEAVKELHTLFLTDGFMGEEPRNVQCLGSRKLGKKVMTTYSFEIPGTPKTMTVTLYVDPATKRPIHASGLAAVQMGGEDMRISYTYDPSIKIKAPQ